jgi:hypothetical protein
MFEIGIKVGHIQWAQHNEFVLNFFKLMALENLANVIIVVIKQMICMEGFANAQRDGKYFGVELSVDLLFYRILILIHNLSAPPICNRVKMHTKVNCSFWNNL